VARAATLLQGGAVAGRKFQPYESHIPFLLQLKVCCAAVLMLILPQLLFCRPLLATKAERAVSLVPTPPPYL
jgi:hypothetical protein